jgi:predicted flap endonuclease-1-like 5' DNA nuclease
MTILVSFRLPAEYTAHATGGVILGEFNNWDPQAATELTRKEDGSMQAELELTAGRTYQYKYLLNDGRWVNDASQTTWTDFSGAFVENSVVEVIPSEETIEAVAEEKIIPVKPRRQVKKVIIADDLTAITGINKKISAALKKNGIITYSQLAKTSVKKLKEILDMHQVDLNKYNPTAWPKEAKARVS